MPEIHEFDTSEYRIPSDAKPQPIPPRILVDVAAASHTGLVRESNEDHYLVARLERSLQTLLTNLGPADLPDARASHGYILAVADGLGGHLAGEMASRLAIHSGLDLILTATNWALRVTAAESA